MFLSNSIQKIKQFSLKYQTRLSHISSHALISSISHDDDIGKDEAEDDGDENDVFNGDLTIIPGGNPDHFS